jgi:hypothetical protein
MGAGFRQGQAPAKSQLSLWIPAALGKLAESPGGAICRVGAIFARHGTLWGRIDISKYEVINSKEWTV